MIFFYNKTSGFGIRDMQCFYVTLTWHYIGGKFQNKRFFFAAIRLQDGGNLHSH